MLRVSSQIALRVLAALRCIHSYLAELHVSSCYSYSQENCYRTCDRFYSSKNLAFVIFLRLELNFYAAHYSFDLFTFHVSKLIQCIFLISIDDVNVICLFASSEVIAFLLHEEDVKDMSFN